MERVKELNSVEDVDYVIKCLVDRRKQLEEAEKPQREPREARKKSDERRKRVGKEKEQVNNASKSRKRRRVDEHEIVHDTKRLKLVDCNACKAKKLKCQSSKGPKANSCDHCRKAKKKCEREPTTSARPSHSDQRRKSSSGSRTVVSASTSSATSSESIIEISDKNLEEFEQDLRSLVSTAQKLLEDFVRVVKGPM